MNYGRIVSSFLVLAASCSAADQRSRSYSFNDKQDEPHNLHTTSSSPQLISFNQQSKMYPDLPSPSLSNLSTSAPSSYIHQPSAPHIPEHYESGPTSPQSKRRSTCFENNYMTVETSTSTEPKPGYYKSESSLETARGKCKAEIQKCKEEYELFIRAVSAKAFQNKEISIPTSPQLTNTTLFTFKNEKQKIADELKRDLQPILNAEQQQLDETINATATVKQLAGKIKICREEFLKGTKNDSQKS